MNIILCVLELVIICIGIRLELLCNDKKVIHDRTVWQIRQLNKSFEYRIKMLESIDKNIN